MISKCQTILPFDLNNHQLCKNFNNLKRNLDLSFLLGLSSDTLLLLLLLFFIGVLDFFLDGSANNFEAFPEWSNENDKNCNLCYNTQKETLNKLTIE
jgi:hypothetical protein